MGNTVVAKVKAVSVGELDELLSDMAGKTASLMADKGVQITKEWLKEKEKHSQLAALEALKTRRVTEQQLVEKDKTGDMKLVVAEVMRLRQYEKAGKTVGGIFIPAMGPNHPLMKRKAEAEAILAAQLKEYNAVVDEAIKQQTAYCKQQGYLGEPGPAVRTTSKK